MDSDQSSKSRRGSSRREFLRYGAAGTVLAFTQPSVFAKAAEPAAVNLSLTGDAFELEELTIRDLQAGMNSGKWTAKTIAQIYLARISAIDKQGPALNAVIEINPDALSEAGALDAERASKGPRGPLHGIPVLLKDNIDTSGRMATTAGSLALAGSPPPTKDAFLVQRLKSAGAVILGKTNLSEWANIRSSRSTSGWSGLGGQTRNPYALDRNPSGSSSGSAAAVAACLAAVAVGTETDGSIVSPSSVNSIVGIKTTVGLISRSGIIPISHSQDTAGPMARTVTDAAILFGAMTGADPLDPVTHGNRGKQPVDYTLFLDPNGLKGARIGVARNFFGTNPMIDLLINSRISEMQRLGAIIIDPVDITTTARLGEPELEVLLYELKADLNKYLAARSPAVQVRSLKDIIAFNEANKDKEMPWFGQELFLKAEAKGPLTDAAYVKALALCQRLARKEGIDAVMTKHRLDAIVAPTDGLPWLTDFINGDHFTGGCSTPPAVAGYPHITVPAGYVSGLPVGISFFGSAYSEPALIKMAYSFEQATMCRRPPRFLPRTVYENNSL